MCVEQKRTAEIHLITYGYSQSQRITNHRSVLKLGRLIF